MRKFEIIMLAWFVNDAVLVYFVWVSLLSPLFTSFNLQINLLLNNEYATY